MIVSGVQQRNSATHIQVSEKLNGSNPVQASETRKQSRPLTLLLTCLDTVLTMYLPVGAQSVTSKMSRNIDKIWSKSWNS